MGIVFGTTVAAGLIGRFVYKKTKQKKAAQQTLTEEKIEQQENKDEKSSVSKDQPV
ncbi:hypothetical protein [Desulfovibrio inopinatus]|uniref:hypothetical protein n=1 Tax=Desulfovibrio inopinatus TaxID=102109 RepID=UPI00040064FD|nr:hypothetical protein [Desulfovibrio inopinatus]